ncbi:hypothetical protein HYT23_06865 [Candidatus Pacearchaeota archaeon]|nr:hypothetical protein [Candidatus Pacearchaeota archaeon]
MVNRVLYDDRQIKVSSNNGEFILHFNLPNKDYRFSKFEVEHLIKRSRPDLESALNGKIENAGLFLIDQGLTYDAVGFVLAQAYAIDGSLVKEENLPKCQSGR